MGVRRRLTATVLALGMVVSSVVGAEAGAAPEPALAEGSWIGTVWLDGWFSSDTERDDGSFDLSVTDVILDTSIDFEAVVDESGSLQGTMNVFIVTFKEGVGTNPVNFDGYLVETYQETTGQLAMSGDASRIVASGTVDVLTLVEAEGKQVADVSGTETVPVEWVFELVAASCSLSHASLVSASRGTVMATALLPPEVETASTLLNRLVVQMTAFPPAVEPLDISDELAAVDEAAATLGEKELPSADDMRALIDAWQKLANLLAALDVCERDMLAPSSAFEQGWLANHLLVAVIKVVYNADAYTATELMDVHDAAAEGGGLTTAFAGFLVEDVRNELAEAVLVDDFQTVLNIAVWAASWGYDDLHAEAHAAMGGQTP